jgi:hypothetical protein
MSQGVMAKMNAQQPLDYTHEERAPHQGDDLPVIGDTATTQAPCRHAQASSTRPPSQHRDTQHQGAGHQGTGHQADHNMAELQWPPTHGVQVAPSRYTYRHTGYPGTVTTTLEILGRVTLARRMSYPGVLAQALAHPCNVTSPKLPTSATAPGQRHMPPTAIIAQASSPTTITRRERCSTWCQHAEEHPHVQGVRT